MNTTATPELVLMGTDSSATVALPDSTSNISKRAARLARGNRRLRQRKIEAAVFAHIKAVRALGRKTINTDEIAEALAVSANEVIRAIDALKPKGVKVAG